MPRLATPARNSMFLDVRETNSAAIALYEGLGFLLESRRRGYYQSSLGREDALVMRKTLESTTVGQPEKRKPIIGVCSASRVVR